MFLSDASLMENTLNRFYVYVHRRKDNNQVFYVGKGTQMRANRSRKSKKWKEISEQAGGFTFEIFKDDLSEKDALSLETELITNPPDDWKLINSVTSFTKATFTKEEICDRFYYEETSPTCLRFKTWNKSNIKKTARYAGDIAGYLLNTKNPPAYYAVRFNAKSCLVHRIIWTMFNGEIPDGFIINHKNNNSLDNRIENLEIITQAINCRRTTKQSRDGAGVYVLKSGKHSYSVANWTENFIRYTKLFSHTKLGEEEATRLAAEFRESKMRQLSHLGYMNDHSN